MTVVSGCVWCGKIVSRGARGLPWTDQRGSAECPGRRGNGQHLGHDHGPGLNCEACYSSEPPQFKEKQ